MVNGKDIDVFLGRRRGFILEKINLNCLELRVIHRIPCSTANELISLAITGMLICFAILTYNLTSVEIPMIVPSSISSNTLSSRPLVMR